MNTHTPHKLCVSILPTSHEELFLLLERCKRELGCEPMSYEPNVEPTLERCAEPYIVELRLDALALHEAQNLDWQRVCRTFPQVLVTYRIATEGGYFHSSEQQRAALYQAAIDAGVFAIDVEYAAWQGIEPLLRWNASTMLVLSHHRFEPEGEHDEGGLPLSGLKTLLRAMFQSEPQGVNVVHKLIFTANDVHAALTAAWARAFASEHGKTLIIHAMGEAGEVSRIIGGVALDSRALPNADTVQAGIVSSTLPYIPPNAWTYTALDANSGTASGQITLHEARHLYRLAHGEALHSEALRSNAPPRLYGLLGFPTKHSKGKVLHNLMYSRLEAEHASPSYHPVRRLYIHFPTPDAERFWRLWNKILSGFSITIPHKERIYGLLEREGMLSEEARLSGVCNTAVKSTSGVWHGYNTDVLALVDCFAPQREHWAHGVVVFGTGATTQSALTALHLCGLQHVTVVGRNAERGAMLAERYGTRFVTPNNAAALIQQGFSGIVQTTSVGMFPNTDEIVEGAEALLVGMNNLVVMDVVYNPRRTRLLQRAEECGHRTIAGEEMFLRQAAHQMRLFTGDAVDLAALRELWERL
jgi:shikimate dehydrogenase/3-dehydroquinate dehydratase type I